MCVRDGSSWWWCCQSIGSCGPCHVCSLSNLLRELQGKSSKGHPGKGLNKFLFCSYFLLVEVNAANVNVIFRTAVSCRCHRGISVCWIMWDYSSCACQAFLLLLNPYSKRDKVPFKCVPFTLATYNQPYHWSVQRCTNYFVLPFAVGRNQSLGAPLSYWH